MEFATMEHYCSCAVHAREGESSDLQSEHVRTVVCLPCSTTCPDLAEFHELQLANLLQALQEHLHATSHVQKESNCGLRKRTNTVQSTRHLETV